ncbi:MAG: membrane protein insertase YidC [Bacteroidota bacterium]|jgi:YidC/Oxa1 family membrane protein insertase|nr:membrane protein insertase YidC [Sphingobacteriales bacterium]
MDRNSIIGLSLIFVILVTFAYINQPSEEQIKAAKHAQDSIALVQLREDSVAKILAAKAIAQDTIKATPDSTFTSKAFGLFAPYATGTESFTSIENDDIKVTFSNKGGRIFKVELKKYKRYDQSPLILMDGQDNEFNYSFATADAKAIQTKDLFFTPLISDDGKSIRMMLSLEEGHFMEQRYTLNSETGTLDYKIELNGLQNVIAPSNNYLDLSISQHAMLQEKSAEAEKRTSTIYYRYTDDEPAFITETTDEKQNLKTAINWIAFKQQYFNTTIIADKFFDNGTIETKSDESGKYVRIMQTSLTVPYNHGEKESFGFKFYFGPNHYKTLAKFDTQLERIIPMGWGIFRWVNKYVVINVFHFLSQFISSFGLIILLLTLIIKTLLLPLVYRSYLSAAKMRALKPELDEIKAKIGDDMGKLQQENMKLYRKAGVNPLGGCVPVLLQLPILFALFQFFPSAFELRGQSFLWAEDLSTYDSILNLPFSIPGYGDHVSLFTILMTVSSIVYAVYNNQMTGVTGQMKWMSYIMPLIFMFVLNSYPAGLNYYYFLSNIVTIGQQLAIRRFVNEDKLHAQIQENKKKPVKKSKFEQKLEDMAKKRGIDTGKLKK